VTAPRCPRGATVSAPGRGRAKARLVGTAGAVSPHSHIRAHLLSGTSTWCASDTIIIYLASTNRATVFGGIELWPDAEARPPSHHARALDGTATEQADLLLAFGVGSRGGSRASPFMALRGELPRRSRGYVGCPYHTGVPLSTYWRRESEDGLVRPPYSLSGGRAAPRLAARTRGRPVSPAVPSPRVG
jgi:hypothetical protein